MLPKRCTADPQFATVKGTLLVQRRLLWKSRGQQAIFLQLMEAPQDIACLRP